MLSSLKQCNICKKVKEGIDFYANPITADGLGTCCKECQKVSSRISRIKLNYNRTEEEYNKAMDTSDCCEICGNDTQLCYDHDHNTGDFRGVLCSTCNTALGKLGDNAEGVLKAYNYLKRYEDDSTS